MDCKYNHDEFCVNDECPMCADYCPVPNDPGVCKYEEREDETYVLSPKGCLAVALDANNIDTKNKFESIWELFVSLMERYNYISR